MVFYRGEITNKRLFITIDKTFYDLDKLKSYMSNLRYLIKDLENLPKLKELKDESGELEFSIDDEGYEDLAKYIMGEAYGIFESNKTKIAMTNDTSLRDITKLKYKTLEKPDIIFIDDNDVQPHYKIKIIGDSIGFEDVSPNKGYLIIFNDEKSKMEIIRRSEELSFEELHSLIEVIRNNELYYDQLNNGDGRILETINQMLKGFKINTYVGVSKEAIQNLN